MSDLCYVGNKHRLHRTNPDVSLHAKESPHRAAGLQATALEPQRRQRSAVCTAAAPTCSATAGRVSKTRTMAPMLRAVPMADSPATPPPMTSILAGGTRPAAVICPVKKRPKWFAASMTALHASH